METNRRQKLEAVRALQIAAENKCVEFDFELQWSARGGAFVEADLHAFFFFLFFFWLYIWAFFFFFFPFQFCSFKSLAIFLGMHTIFFYKNFRIFLSPQSENCFAEEKKSSAI
jgi:hypothetical protein